MYNFFPKIYDKFMEYADYSLWKDLVLTAIKKYDIDTVNFIDLGCGTGKLLSLLSDRFAECDGIDISENMIKKAKDKTKDQKNINVFLDDMVTFRSTKKYDVATAFFDTVNHILSEEELTFHLKA